MELYFPGTVRGYNTEEEFYFYFMFIYLFIYLLFISFREISGTVVVSYAANWANFKPKLKKIKMSIRKKNILIFQEMERSCPPNLIKNFLKFLAKET